MNITTLGYTTISKAKQNNGSKTQKVPAFNGKITLITEDLSKLDLFKNTANLIKNTFNGLEIPYEITRPSESKIIFSILEKFNEKAKKIFEGFNSAFDEYKAFNPSFKITFDK